MNLNWELFDEKLKGIKYPYVLIRKFFNNIHLIDDVNASIILRYIIKNHINIFLTNPFHVLVNKLPNSYMETNEVIMFFYINIKRRGKIISELKKWHKSFASRFFWQKKIEDQILFLYDIKLKIQANFDTSKGGVSFIIKMIPILKTYNKDIRDETIISAFERLRNVYKLLGAKFFIYHKIPILTSEDFYELEDIHMLKYLNIIYSKTIDNLIVTINLFEQLNIINLKLYNLLNPCIVKIEEVSISVETDEEIEDMSILF